MKTGKAARVLLTVLALVGAISYCACAAPSSYDRTIQPIGNGFGMASIVNTETSTDPAYPINRYPSGSGVCSAFSTGNNYRVNGGMFDFGLLPGYGTNVEDIIGFYFTYSPSSPDTLSVWRNLIAKTDPTLTGNIRDTGYGGVSQSGRFSFRADGYSGGTTGNAIGALQVDSPTTLNLTSFGTGYTLLAGGTSVTNTWTVGPIGETSDMVVSSDFAKFLGIMHPSWTGGTGDLSPSARYLTATNQDHRGSPAINDTAKVIAACTQANNGETYNKGEYFRLRVINYTGDASSFSKTSDVTYNFKNIGDGKTYAYANFFSRSSYSGPQQISINDNGDIAFPVVINVAGGSSSDDTVYRMASRRGVLFMSHNTPGVFKCVVDNALACPVLLCDTRPDATKQFAPCIGGVAIDNDCNVYFSGCSWGGFWPTTATTDLTFTNAIYKASANSSTNPTGWSVKPILWRGTTWKEDTGLGIANQQVTILPLGNSGAEWFANTSAFCCTGINRTKIPGKAGANYGLGGLFLSCGVGIDGVTGNTMRGIYLAPTDQAAATTTVAQATALADGEPINLCDCAIVAFRGTYTGTTGNTYYRYDVTDGKNKLMISTIRTNSTSTWAPLCLGDKINVSGFMATDTTSTPSERYISSTGLVVTGIQSYGMANKAIGAAKGLSVTGRRVKTYGVVSNVDTSAKTFTLDDGSGNPLTVDYTLPSVRIAAPTNGQHVVIDGLAGVGQDGVTPATPTTVTMVWDSSISSY